jgi:beta-lactam-binding protein with PASTA domain
MNLTRTGYSRVKANRRALEAAFAIAAVCFAVFAAGCSSTVVVPAVEGMGVDAARRALEDAGLRMEEPASVESERASVKSTEPEAGQKINKGAGVKVLLSVTLPDLTGLTSQEAGRRLTGLGMEFSEVSGYSDTVEEGRVSDMTPRPGEEATTGTNVTVTVSKGSMYVTCPQCGGSGRITEETDCKDNRISWCRQYVTVCCPTCSGKGTVPRADRR